MKSCSLFFALTALCCGQAAAPSVAERLVSPEVQNGKITFRIYAPKAESVTLNGDWMKLGTQIPLEKSAEGVWSVTVGPLEPQVYLYSFRVDGMVLADPVNPRIKLRARTSASLVEVPGEAAWIHKDVPHGRVEMLTHHSKVLGDVREVYVYTPPGYDLRHQERYPVLYLMHGNNDVAAGWTVTGRAHVIMDNLIAEGKAKPSIVVMPWAHAAPYGAAGQRNMELFEKYLVGEVMPLVDGAYRTKRKPEARALAGLSMGASQSFYVGFRHLDLFGNIGLFSLGGWAKSWAESCKGALEDAAGTNKKLKVFWIAIGTEDEGVERNREFRQFLRDKGIRFLEAEVKGAHFYPVFRRELSEFLPLVFRD